MPYCNEPASVALPSDSKQGLYDPAFERDSCGVGFVADMSGRKSHATIQSGLQVLKNLQHRGACGCDQDTGDGAGILMQLPDLFFRSDNTSLSDRLPAAGDYGVAFVFLPRGASQRLICHRTLEAVVAAEGQRMLGWRDVPVVSSAIGWLARSQEPVMEQLFIGRGEGTAAGDQFERKLYVIRRRAEKWAYSESIGNDALGFAIASCSARTIVYKGMLKPDQLPAYLPDLDDSRLESALALVHSRYSTNTFPRWGLAQPFHLLAHNGEINTLQGNLHWMKARESRLRSRVLGADLEKALPLDFEGMSDSAALDQVLALLVQSGRSLPHALMMLVPEAYEGDRSLDPARRAFYQYHSGLVKPWDGPASLVFCDGIRIGAMLDRNGLRPGRYVVTHDNLVVLASEAGVLPIPPEAIRLSGRLQPGKIFLVDLAEGRIIGDEELNESICRAQPYGLWLEKHQIHLGDLPPAEVPAANLDTLLARQQAFGYTQEDVLRILLPMAQDGKEPVSSMGTDIPLAVLSRRSQILPNYFKQLFAQVTNPPIDPIREKVVMSTESLLGSEQNLLDESPEHARLLRLKSPTLSNAELARLRAVRSLGFHCQTLSILFDRTQGEAGLAPALDRLCAAASQAVDRGATILILSDRDLNADLVPVPPLLATAAVHHHLIRKGQRTRCGIVVETGEAREIHHFALLIGYGAGAVNPYLVALVALHDTNNFPEFTGKTCPAPCEASCVLALNGAAVTIKDIEAAIVDRGWEMGWIVARPPARETGKSVAIAGSGPAGLAAAQQLRRAGHTVTIYERDDRAGGLLAYGIPDFKMAKVHVERRIDQLEGEGVRFILNAEIGRTIDPHELRARHDAILLTIGATVSRDLEIPGKQLKGIELAMPFLTQQNRRNLGTLNGETPILATGKNVIVIGGGDTAADCLGTCHRQQARSVMQLDYNPRPPEGENPDTPWPLWPKVLRITPAHEEGGKRDWQIKTKTFAGDDRGHVKELHAVRVYQYFDEAGERQFEEVHGSELIFPCELVLLAIGFSGPENRLPQALGLALTEQGVIRCNHQYMTSQEGVFAAGDCRRGQSLVVWAIAEGREAARHIDHYLTGQLSTLRARDRSLVQIEPLPLAVPGT